MYPNPDVNSTPESSETSVFYCGGLYAEMTFGQMDETLAVQQ